MKNYCKIVFTLVLLGVVAGVAIEVHAYGRVKRIKQGIFLYSNWDAPYLTVDTCLDMSVTEAIVPDFVTWYGRDYGIAEIGPGAFHGCHNLVKLNIGSAFKILKGALLDCPNLRVIITHSKIPPLLENQHPYYGCKWDEVIEPYHTLTTTIVVPEGCEEAYRKAPGWKEFKTIQSYEPDGSELDIDEIDVQINNLESKLIRIEQEAARIRKELEALRNAKLSPSVSDN